MINASRTSAVAIRTSLVLLTALTADVLAQDYSDVVVVRAESGGKIKQPCRILDYSGDGLIIETKTGSRQRIPAESVVSMQTTYTEPHHRGLAEFREQRVDDAERSLQAAVKLEDRLWVRREIVAVLVRCSLWRGEYAEAAGRFLTLVESDKDTRHFRLIPLIWAPQELPDGWKAEARTWIAGGNDTTRLTGASFLLLDRDLGDRARSALTSLTTSTDVRVRRLAAAQLWRLRLVTGDVNPLELDRWQDHIESMPEELRGGPYYLLGRARSVRREYNRAAVALLWLPLIYDADRPLAARACLEAADALTHLGQTGEARNLYRELTVRFRETSFALEAADVLKSMPSTGQESDGVSVDGAESAREPAE